MMKVVQGTFEWRKLYGFALSMEVDANQLPFIHTDARTNLRNWLMNSGVDKDDPPYIGVFYTYSESCKKSSKLRPAEFCRAANSHLRYSLARTVG
jgi:hypothetical protein